MCGLGLLLPDPMDAHCIFVLRCYSPGTAGAERTKDVVKEIEGEGGR